MDVLGNTVRRQIIRKLGEGPDYTLRLSGELRIGQQLATRHLKILEDAGLVDVSWVSSDRGARRKLYSLNKFYSVRIDFAPNLYSESLTSFDDPMQWFEDSSELDEIEERLRKLMRNTSSTEQLNPINLIISEVDEELNALERKRAKLLYIRNMAMKETLDSMVNIDRSERQMVQHVMDKGSSSVEELSQHLQIREETVRNLLEQLINKNLLEKKGEEIKIQPQNA
jgi:predicted transcriptional regulator